MDIETRGWRVSLALRIFLGCTLLITLAVACVVVATRYFGQSVSVDAAQHALSKAAETQNRIGQQRLRLLELSAGVIANDSGLASYFAASMGDDLGLGTGAAPDVNSLRDLLAERQQQFAFDLGILLDANANVLTRSDRGESFVHALDQDPLVAAALRHLTPQSGYWRFENGLYQAVLVPMTQDGGLLGFLLLAQRVDDVLSRELARASDADIAFWLPQAGQAPRLLATSLAAERAQALRSVFADTKSPGLPVQSRASMPFPVEFAGQTWLGRSASIPLAGTQQAVTASALLSRDAVLDGYERIFDLSLWAGLVALALALLLLLSLSRWMRAPARKLAVLAETAVSGNYDVPVAISGSDDLARLSRSLASLLSSLREQRDLDAYIADVSRHLPDASASTTADALRIESASNGTRTRRGGPTLADLPIGSRLGARYEVLSLLGSGGMGVVYKVRDLELGDVAALKLLRSGALQDNEQLERLKDEIRLARKITHPNVLRTFDFGEAEGRAFITMEYVHGITLRALLKQSARLPYSAGLRIARQLVAGLEAAHAVGVLHRDIKPENLILETGGNAKLMDFGIARPVYRHGAGLTQAGMVVGSPDYSAPEQITGGAVDERADLYSCGVVLSELLCGVRPYHGNSAVEIYMAQMSNRPLRPSTAWAEIPPVLEAIILRCVSVQPDDRYRHATELGLALAGLKA